MADMVMMGYRTQALALAHHTYGFALLVRSQLWLGSKFDASFSGCGAPPLARARMRLFTHRLVPGLMAARHLLKIFSGDTAWLDSRYRIQRRISARCSLRTQMYNAMSAIREMGTPIAPPGGAMAT